MRSFLFLALFILSACSPGEKAAPTTNIIPDDDYVLIEFASKLEEDHHRIHNIPMESTEVEPEAHPKTEIKE